MPLDSPPRPRCAFRVAAIGHRWDQLDAAHAGVIGERFQEILVATGAVATDLATTPEAGFDGDTPRLTLLSGLAEGTDRIAALAALNIGGWQLHAVAPFALERYEQDFTLATSLHEFRRLWRAAGARTVLDGHAGEFDAYAPLSRTLVDFSDLLIVVWNGERGRGPGGTAASVEIARVEDVPIIRIDPDQPRSCWLEDLAADDHGRSRGLAGLDDRLRSLLAPPPPVANDEDNRHHDMRAEYFAERIAIDTTAGRTTWASNWRGMPPEVANAVLGHFAEAHQWADQLANAYARRFRRTFTTIFVLAPLAVVAAYLGAIEFAGSIARLSAVGIVEMAILATISWMVARGRRRRLRERWLDYRALAERLRHLSVLWPLGRSTPMVRVPPPGIRNDARLSWVGWLLRCTAREAGLAEVDCTPAYAEQCRDLLRNAEIAPQRSFHSGKVTRSAQHHHALAAAAERLFLGALFFAAIHLLLGILPAKWPAASRDRRMVELLLAGFCVALPAMAASIHGYLGIGDFAGVAVRSAGIEPRLAQIEARLLRLDPVDVTAVGELATEATALMETELVTWRTVAETRVLETP